MLALTLIGLVLLVACSALLTGAEAAYFSLGRARLREASGEQRAMAPLIERPHDLLVTLLVAITFINIGASAIAAEVASALFGARGLAVAIGGMVFLLTVFGEVLPMTIAVKSPARFTALVSRPVAWLSWLLTPVRVTLSGLTALTLKAIGQRRSDEPELSE